MTEEEVKDFYKIDEIEARTSGNVGNKKKVKKNVIVMLQKQAAELGGNVILITKSEALGAYGEMPGYNIKGIVYSLEPPAGNKVKRR